MKKCSDCDQLFDETLSSCPNCGCPVENCKTIDMQNIHAYSINQPTQPNTGQPWLNKSGQQPLPAQQPINNAGSVDYASRRVFFILAGSIACLGAFAVLMGEIVRMMVPVMMGFFFLLITAGITLIGLGISIRR